MGFDEVQYALGKKNRKVTLPSNTNVPVGGIDINTKIKDVDINDLFTNMLIRSLAPKTNLQFYDSLGNIIDTSLIRTTGVPLLIKTIKAISEKSTESDIIVSMQTYSNPIINDFSKIDIEPNSSLNEWTFNNITIDETTTFSVTTSNEKGFIGKYNTVFNFVNCCYVGLMPIETTIETITQEEIKNGTTILQQKNTINNLFNGIGKIFFAYDSTWGNAKTIVDVMNNVNIISAFEKKNLVISNESGTVTYILYLANVRGNYSDSEVSLKF